MKASFYALLALIAISLSACTTMNPMQPTATVYPVTEGTIVQAAPAEVAPATVAPAVTEEVMSAAFAEVLETTEAPVEPLMPTLARVSESELTCMAMAIYHEARGESERGQSAVAWVIVNRVNHPKFPKTICGVVHEPTKKACQFSWYCDGKSDIPRDLTSYARARDIALRVINRQLANPVSRSVFFDGYVHGTKRKPGQMQIGSHRFYASYSSRSTPPKAKRKRS